MIKIRTYVENIKIKYPDGGFEVTGYKHKLVIIIFKKEICLKSIIKQCFLPGASLFKEIRIIFNCA